LELLDVVEKMTDTILRSVRFEFLDGDIKNTRIEDRLLRRHLQNQIQAVVTAHPKLQENRVCQLQQIQTDGVWVFKEIDPPQPIKGGE
jgi:hypothetical protein